MADNVPVPEDSPKPPAPPTVPPLKPGIIRRVVVALSAVAKAPPPLAAKQASRDAKPPKLEAPRGSLSPVAPAPINSGVRGEPTSDLAGAPPLVNSAAKEAVVTKVISPPSLPETNRPSDVSTASPLVILPPIGPVVETSTLLQPPTILSKPASSEAVTTNRPPPLPPPKSLDKAASSGIHVVPKMVGAEPVAHGEKLRPPPQLPHEGSSVTGVLPPPIISSETAAPPRIPALIPSEPVLEGKLPPALPAKTAPISPPNLTVVPPIIHPENSAGSVVTTKGLPPPLDPAVKAPEQLSIKREETKPALRPAVLPNKALITPKGTEPIEPLVVAGSMDKAATVVPPATSVKVEAGKLHTPIGLPANKSDKPSLPLTRVARAKKRRVVEMVVFYILMLGVGAALYLGTIHFTQETRVEGQVIPPAGMPLADEVWIVSDFRQLTSGITEDLAQERAPLLQEMHERQDHVQRVQADLAMREERIRLLQAQIQSAKDEEANVVKQARDEAQQLWDGPGTELDDEYNSRQSSLKSAIAGRAKSLNLKYAPDPTYNAPEVWANAYRLALYEVPTGVDSAKEYQWLNDQMKAWRDFVKAQDDKREQLREQAAQIKMSPASKLTDLNAKIEELQHRIDSTQSEEDPLKPELQQAQADLAETQTTESGLDGKYYKQLSALPGASITKRLNLEPDGRFTWSNLENDSPFAEGENVHHYWIFARATRADGREYWALGRFSIEKNHTLGLLIEPDGFVSTKAMLRPELSPDEQAQ